MSLLASQTLFGLHGVFKTEVVIHVFGIDTEQAVEVETDSGFNLRRITDKSSDIVAAQTRPRASVKGKMIEI
jgi:hypothetical protein